MPSFVVYDYEPDAATFMLHLYFRKSIKRPVVAIAIAAGSLSWSNIQSPRLLFESVFYCQAVLNGNLEILVLTGLFVVLGVRVYSLDEDESLNMGWFSIHSVRNGFCMEYDRYRYRQIFIENFFKALIVRQRLGFKGKF